MAPKSQSNSDEEASNELAHGLYNVDGDPSGLVRNPAGQVLAMIFYLTLSKAYQNGSKVD